MINQIKMLSLAGFIIAVFGMPGFGENITIRNEQWSLHLDSHVDCDTCPLSLAATNAKSQAVVQFPFTDGVPKSGKLFGSMAVIAAGGRSSEHLAIYDLNGNRRVESIIGWKFSISPPGRYTAFVGFYDVHDPRFHRSDVILLYDVARSPEINRVPKNRSKISEYEAGMPIFPRRNKEQQQSWSFDDLNYDVISFGWSASGNTLGFIAEETSPGRGRMGQGYKTKELIIGVVDITGGIEKSLVYLKKIPIQELLRPENKNEKVKFFADKVSMDDGGNLSIQATSIRQLKPQFTINLFKNHDEKY